MKSFLSRFGSKITGVLSGLDRLVFRGTLIPLVRKNGFLSFLNRACVRLVEFRAFVIETSEKLKQASLAEARREQRPVIYLASSQTNKEELVGKILREQPVEKGLVCALKTVEPCLSFEYHRSPDPKERGIRLVTKKCLHIYKYWRHPSFGLIGSRLQTWFPFNCQVWLNGREWLALRMKNKEIPFERNDNCFTRIDDVESAQELMNEQLTINWKKALDDVAGRLNPLHQKIFESWPMEYNWSVYQAEWATDLMFNDEAALAELYPALVRHGMLCLSSEDVLRFLGKKPHGNLKAEIVTSFKKRTEGVRVKHWLSGNSIKMYNKGSLVLRVETTTANTKSLPKVFRALTNKPKGKQAWRSMRKGVADIHRRAEVSQKANERYLDALSAVDDSTPLAKIFNEVSRSVTMQGRQSRALRIGDEQDLALLEAINRGEFTLNGVRNRDLQRLLHPDQRDASPQDKKKLSAKIGRQIRLLRAHGILHKVSQSHCYRLSDKGRLLCAALSASRESTTKQLLIRDAA